MKRDPPRKIVPSIGTASIGSGPQKPLSAAIFVALWIVLLVFGYLAYSLWNADAASQQQPHTEITVPWPSTVNTVVAPISSMVSGHVEGVELQNDLVEDLVENMVRGFGRLDSSRDGVT